jgi:hypothetical protein
MAWLAVGVVGAVVGLTTGLARAADHTDPPDRASDSAADIADLYAWHGDGTLTTVVTFAGLTMPGDPATYDEDVLYGIHIDTNDDQQSDHDIWIRFGQNGDGEMGVQVSGVPGEDAPLVGPVETTLESDTGTKAYAGLRDDPFFFDLEGFMSTLDTGSLQFDSNRDSFAGTNVTAVVVELPLEAISSDSFDVWATTARINGGA